MHGHIPVPNGQERSKCSACVKIFSECKYKLQFGTRISSIEVSKQGYASLCRAWSTANTRSSPREPHFSRMVSEYDIAFHWACAVKKNSGV